MKEFIKELNFLKNQKVCTKYKVTQYRKPAFKAQIRMKTRTRNPRPKTKTKTKKARIQSARVRTQPSRNRNYMVADDNYDFEVGILEKVAKNKKRV
jgi:hypothetical protein